MDFTNYKSDTARKTAAREMVAKICYEALAAHPEIPEVLFTDIPFAVEVETESGDLKETCKVSSNSVCVNCGTVLDKDGAPVDMVMIVSPEVKAFNTTTNKKQQTTYAVNFFDIQDAYKEAKEQKGKKKK